PVEARLAVDFRRPYDVRLVPVAAPWFAAAEGPTVVVTNRRHVKARCEVTLVASDWPPERQSVTLAGRAEQEVMFSQPGGLGAPMPRRLQVGVVGGGREFWTDLPVDWAAAPRLSRAVVVDGDLSDWPFRADFHLTEEHQVVDVRGWSRHDLSAVACTAWDDDFLYLGVEVTDDEHVQMETGELIWTGDSVQFAIDALGNGGHAYDDDDYEYGLALTPGGPVIWRWHGAEYRHVGEVAFGDLAVRRGDCGTVYEMALPWRELTPLEPKRDATFGFTLAVNDADESRQGKNVREGAIQFTPGIIHEKDPSKFARWRLIGALDGDGG
ncbi:MAG: sugar-binding protein, partial [Armatimonadota bacterium]